MADTVAFLDANVLASPVTRTLVIAGGRFDGLLLTWSAHLEAEADRHARGVSSRTSVIRRDILRMELSESAPTTEGLLTASAEDRQVLADAVLAGARFLITTDVADFALEDLRPHELSAVNPDYVHGAPVQRACIQGRRAHPCRGREEPIENRRRGPRHARPAPSPRDGTIRGRVRDASGRRGPRPTERAHTRRDLCALRREAQGQKAPDQRPVQ